MKPVFVRPYRPADFSAFTEWLFSGKDNKPDSAAITAPSSFTLCAFSEDRPILFAPAQTPFFLESLAVNPEASELEQAAALKAVTQFLVSQAFIQGRSELYFLSTNEVTTKFAANHGFEEVPYKLFRMSVSDLEPDPKG